MAKIWVGIDIGKEHHHIAAVNADRRLAYYAASPTTNAPSWPRWPKSAQRVGHRG